MPIIYTDEFDPATFPQSTVRQIYNGLDCCITSEVLTALRPLSGNAPNIIYDFERALQAPVLEMMQRGFKIDEYERRKGIALLQSQISHLDKWLQELAIAVWGKTLNPRSPKQLIDFFYSAMRLPEQWKNDKGNKRLSTDREALEKLEVYFYARPIISTILEIRNLAKKLSVLETEIDPDLRFRPNFNIAGTETGRFSSSSNAFGTASNIQNITPELRKIFIADAGYKLVGIDLEQAESREVGWQCGVLFGDWSYLDAAYSGDLHTTVTRFNWRDLPWTDDPKANKAIAEQPYYRHYTYRDMSKKLGHGCLTEDHEVLTRNGWVKISDKPTEIMAWSPSDSNFELVSNWVDKDFNGKFIFVEGSSLSLEMTEDHRVVYRTSEQNPWKETPAGNLASLKSGIIPLGFGYVGGTVNIDPNLARLIVAFQHDGTQASKGVINFRLTKQRKKDRLAKLCQKANVPHKEHNAGFYVYAQDWPKHPGSYLLEWSSLALLAFVDEQEYWDGSRAENSKVSVYSTKLEDLEWVQTIGRLLGTGGNIWGPRISGFGSEVWELKQNNRNYAALRQIKITEEVKTQRVFCPTVKSGAFYVRHKGKISVTGNSNYFGQPWTMSRHAKIPVKMAEDFQVRYFEAFPGIPRWHRHVAQQLQQNQLLVTPFGRRRHFFGRPNDDSTLREAIAYTPQSSTADRTNLILYRIWKNMRDRVQLLAQVHDAIYFQFPEHLDEQEIISEAMSYFEIKIEHGERRLIVPGEAKLGWNWASFDAETNPDGLKKFKPGVKDNRQRHVGINRIL